MPDEQLDLKAEIYKTTALKLGKEADIIVDHLYGHIKSDASYNAFICMLVVDEKGLQTYRSVVGLIVSKLCMRLAQEWQGWTNLTQQELLDKLKQIEDYGDTDTHFTSSPFSE